MIGGCLIALVSFCLLPYLMVPGSSLAFTGWELVTLGRYIYLPPDPNVSGSPTGWTLLNIPFIGVSLLLVVLLLLAAVGDLVLTWTTEPARRRITRGVRIVASLTLCFSLCSGGYYAAVAGCCVASHGDHAQPFQGSLLTPGFLGFVVGLVVALIGTIMTLRAKTIEQAAPGATRDSSRR